MPATLAEKSAMQVQIASRKPLCPSLYQINTRATLQELSQKLGRPATLDDMPDAMLDQLAARGFDWVWFLGVWQTGAIGRKVSREQSEWQAEYRETLSDLRPDDITGSPFAVVGYTVNTDFGGNAALERLRRRVQQRGVHLLLDFVPNHTAIDHPWVQSHPEYYVRGTEDLLRQQPQNYIRLGSTVFAYGRDPYFSGWPDTLQLNYAEPSFQEAMKAELRKVAGMCDGVRCDMAMLVLPDVFQRTWGRRPAPFWENAIQGVRAMHPEFIFMAEVYWDLEWTMQQLGFDYTYDKKLYDRLREGHARPVREHLHAEMSYQRKSARFLENHDEPRAAATFAPEVHRAAGVLTFLCPGLRFFHDGEFEGRRKKLSMHLGRRPEEPVDTSLRQYYERLLSVLQHDVVRNGTWQMLDCTSAWDGNWTWDCFICSAWRSGGEAPLVVIANYAANRSQCYVRIPFDEFRGKSVRLQDLMGSALYERDGSTLTSRGLYLDLPPWGYHVFQLTTV